MWQCVFQETYLGNKKLSSHVTYILNRDQQRQPSLGMIFKVFLIFKIIVLKDLKKLMNTKEKKKGLF